MTLIRRYVERAASVQRQLSLLSLNTPGFLCGISRIDFDVLYMYLKHHS